MEKTLEKMSRKGDGDWIDRLSSRTTVKILLFAALGVSTNLVIMQPIQCYLPKEMTDDGNLWEKYVENLCYVQNTYFVPPGKRIELLTNPKANRDEGKVVGYYQWIPFILLLQAFMFYVPKIIWRILSNLSGESLFFPFIFNSSQFSFQESTSTPCS